MLLLLNVRRWKCGMEKYGLDINQSLLRFGIIIFESFSQPQMFFYLFD